MKAIIEIEVELESYATQQDLLDGVVYALLISDNFQTSAKSYTVKLKEQ